MTSFPDHAPVAYPVFYRTYSRSIEGRRESWQDVCDRTIRGLEELGKLTPEEVALIDRMQRELKCLCSGRWLWVGGTDWVSKPVNFSGAYNCTSTNIVDWRSFGLLMDLAMQGSGTGAVLELHYIDRLPVIRNRLNVQVVGTIGATPKEKRREETEVRINGNRVEILVGDSRKGWVTSYQTLLELSADERFNPPEIEVVVDISDIRPSGEPLSGFGGVANPVKLPGLYDRCAYILNKAIGRKLNSLECCLLIDEAALCVVAGNIRRSAGIRQFSADDPIGSTAKDNLWQQDEQGNWRIDPDRDALRMANHTRVFHRKPTLQETIDAVRKQYYSGEGAIQWAGEAVARASADVITPELKTDFIRAYERGKGQEWLHNKLPDVNDRELSHRLSRYGLNPCGEIIMSDNHCNLAEVHLNMIDPNDRSTQEEAFRAGALSVASLLNHRFVEERYRRARELDPIVGVSFTGLFDFFVHAFGVEWLEWWAEDRPEHDRGLVFKSKEAEYLTYWREIVQQTVWEYCDRHGLKRPNRCTTVQPAGTKSLLTNASPGWHPPKAQRYIRRITFRREDPIALACLDYGYSIVPSQSDKDETGKLLDDPFDPRCTEWLVEIPVEVSWANLPGTDQIDIAKFSALAQFDFYMQVQKFYTRHNTSATIELREHEIEPLAQRIYQAIQTDEGYISAALLARFDDLQTFPRLPFEPIDKATYDGLMKEVIARRKIKDFHEAVARYDRGEREEAGPAGCDSDKCMLPEEQP